MTRYSSAGPCSSGLTEATLGQARQVATALTQVSAMKTTKLREEVEGLLPRVEQALDPTRRRVFQGEQLRAEEKLLTGDCGVHSEGNERYARRKGVNQVVLPKPGAKTARRKAKEKQPWFRRGMRWRAGIEGRISVLQRRYGLDRCLYHGEEGMEGVTPLLRAAPSDEMRAGPYANPPGPYPHIVEVAGQRETIAWVREREDGGRGFGYTGAHFHANWDHPNARTLVLNALLWIAGAEVPPGGVACDVRAEEMMELHPNR
jgi:hypothetical protein